MKKLLYLSLAVTFLGNVCSESEALRKFTKKTSQLGLAREKAGEKTNIDVKKAVERGDISTAEYVDAYIVRGNRHIDGNWAPLKEKVEPKNLITRLMAYVDYTDSVKNGALLDGDTFDFPPADAGHLTAVSYGFSTQTIARINPDGKGNLDSRLTLNDVLTRLENCNFAKLYNVTRLLLMGTMVAVIRGHGIPREDFDAVNASSDAELIGPAGANNLVTPWVYPQGGPTDAQKLQAARIYDKIAESLEYF